MLLEIDSISKRFGGLWALRDVSFSVDENVIHGLIGPNGSGKSTMLNTIMGRYQPTEGRVVFAGQDLGRAKPSKRAGMGISIKFQVTSVFPGLSVRDNVRLGLSSSSREVEEAATSELMDTVGLSEKADFLASELGHGEQQWLEIAIAIAQKPRLLLLDEPTSGMGREETTKTVGLLKELQGSMAMLVIEHDMDFVKAVCNRITVLDRGKFLTEGTYDEVRNDERVLSAYLGKSRADGNAS